MYRTPTAAPRRDHALPPGLQVERLQGAEGQRAMKQFPVVMRQWTAIQRFRATILSSCHAAVRDATLEQLEVGDGDGRGGMGCEVITRGISVAMWLRDDNIGRPISSFFYTPINASC